MAKINKNGLKTLIVRYENLAIVEDAWKLGKYCDEMVFTQCGKKILYLLNLTKLETFFNQNIKPLKDFLLIHS